MIVTHKQPIRILCKYTPPIVFEPIVLNDPMVGDPLFTLTSSVTAKNDATATIVVTIVTLDHSVTARTIYEDDSPMSKIGLGCIMMTFFQSIISCFISNKHVLIGST